MKKLKTNYVLMKSCCYIISFLFVYLISPYVAHAQITPDKLDAVDQYISQQYQRFGLPGVAVSISTPDTVLFARGYGYGTRGDNPITENTPFYIGSVTKTFTAFAIAKLRENNHLNFDDPVESCLPDFSMKSPFSAESITIRHLIHHRSGLRQWDGHDQKAQYKGNYNHLTPFGEPGKKFEYSSLNYMILGSVVEACSQQMYSEYLNESLFGPLQMEHTFVEEEQYPVDQIIQGHKNYFGFNVRRMEPGPPRYLVPAGHLAASVYDLGKYGGMLVGKGIFKGQQILQPETVDKLLSPMNDIGPAMSWGYGEKYGSTVLGHSGNAQTSSARMRLLPEKEYAISVLTNTGTGPFFDSSQHILNGVNDILEGKNVQPTWPREKYFKGAILLGTLLSIVGMTRQAIHWKKTGYSTQINFSGKIVGRLAFDAGVAAMVIFGLPRYIGVPLTTMLDYFPDLGIAIVASAGAGAIGGVFRTFVKSAK